MLNDYVLLALGLLTLVLDALKGLAAVAMTRAFFPGQNVLSGVAALFAVLGHMFPIWLKFREERVWRRGWDLLSC